MRFNSSELLEFLEMYEQSSFNIKKSSRNICIQEIVKSDLEVYKKDSDCLKEISFKNNKIELNIKGRERIKVEVPTFEIGKITVFKGASGSGKTTIMSYINLLNKSSNQLNLNSKKFNLAEKCEYAEIFNRTIRFSKFIYYSCRSDFYILEKISIDRYINNLEILISEDHKLLKRLKNLSYFDARSLPLSTGQINRVNLAYILSSKSAKFIFMDEPTANLDKSNSKLVADLINDYKKEYCFTIASHDEAFDKIATSIITL
jgi:ABC-type lipoprotein export system ATPase subunit